MTLILKNPLVLVDVDDTLVWWNPKYEWQKRKPIIFKFNGQLLTRYVIMENVKEVILQKQSGSDIIIWSASGHKWAEVIAKKTGLIDYVDLIASKPIRIYDDQPITNWMPNPRNYSKKGE